MDKKVKPDLRKAEPRKFVLMDKKELIKLLHDYEAGVKRIEEVQPFVDIYFDRLMRLNMGLK